jgi:hypothetical protein
MLLLLKHFTFKTMGSDQFDGGFNTDIVAFNPKNFIAVFQVKVYLREWEMNTQSRDELLCHLNLMHVGFEYLNHAPFPK